MGWILLAEDEPVLGKLVKEALERKAWKVLWARDGQEAYDMYCRYQPALCILDVMMPAINGFVLAGMIRNLSETVPILFLTARSETVDVIKGFESGGNDYLKKPFSLEELILRIQELLRRSGEGRTEQPAPASPAYFQIGKYQFSPVTQLLRTEEESFKLSFKESEVLRLLLEHKNTLMPRKETLITIWGDDSFFNSRTMDVYIARLRKYLKHDPSLSIVNIRGFGFKLIEE